MRREVLNEASLSQQVWREFQAIFRQQERMKTFPRYGSTEVERSQRERRSHGVTLKKEASWIAFIRVGSLRIREAQMPRFIQNE